MSKIMDDLSKARLAMVLHQIAARGIRNEALLTAMRKVPREVFVPPHLAEFAYQDTPLLIEGDQIIAQPFIVAAMIENAHPNPGDRALEVGTVTGYGAAILSQLAREVYAVEADEKLVAAARQRFADLGYDNVQVRHGDPSFGWSEHAPYDLILVTAGVP
jgi:protein-L-isoaspartate(D-aspartate) O-methyltransferase